MKAALKELAPHAATATTAFHLLVKHLDAMLIIHDTARKGESVVSPLFLFGVLVGYLVIVFVVIHRKHKRREADEAASRNAEDA